MKITNKMSAQEEFFNFLAVCILEGDNKSYLNLEENKYKLTNWNHWQYGIVNYPK
jgi:hypothetical protein